MKQSDKIRQFVVEQYIKPAREQQLSETTVRAGDVHKRMGLKSSMPSVCSAIGGKRFLELASVELRHRSGPKIGSNVYFTYQLSLTSRPSKSPAKSVPRAKPAATVAIKAKIPNFENAVVLISCVKTKSSRRSPARDLYTSNWFRLARELVETNDATWFVLSAKHGLVRPEARIAPYELTLNQMSIDERRRWARKVSDELIAETKGCKRVIFLAGRRYREFLIEPLSEAGIDVDVPMNQLTQGRQLSWLKQVLAKTPSGDASTTTVPQENSDRSKDIRHFYELLDTLSLQHGGPRYLRDLGNHRDWPKRGIYFFFEDGELRSGSGSGLRITRVGTHAVSKGSKSKLVNRLRSHRGKLNGEGDHRSSIFRGLIGQALIGSDSSLRSASWGLKPNIVSISKDIGVSETLLKSDERLVERRVSEHLDSMPFLWIDVDDEPSKNSLRSYIERNAIALLSNIPNLAIDPPSRKWLGHKSNRVAVRESGLWNQQHTEENYNPDFLDAMHKFI